MDAGRAAPAVVLAGGLFAAGVDRAQASLGLGPRDLTGRYEAGIRGGTLRLDLVHDPAGHLGGVAVYVLAGGARVDLAVRGSVQGSRGCVTVHARLSSAARRAATTGSMGLDLALDDGRLQLEGRLRGTSCGNRPLFP